jgi:hypothetical protein
MNALRDFSCTVLLFGVCAVPACGPPRAPSGSPARIVAPDQRDGEVLQALLLHLLGDPEFGNRPALTNGAVIVLDARTSNWPHIIDGEPMRLDLEEQGLPSDLESGAFFRSNQPNTTNYFTNFTFVSPIVVVDIEGMGWKAFVKAYPKPRGYVEAALPGYSDDGKRAVVFATFGPSSHGAMATAVLEKSGDKWVVKWHRLFFFM